MTTQVQHPGKFVRANVIPPGMSVTAAAEVLGVGRPALSNMLNGRAALSPDMALRLAKAFDADSETLLKLQRVYDRQRMQAKEPEIAVRAYAPSVLSIKAMQIAAWAERMEARSQLGALLRRLVTSSGSKLTKVDFPAHEQAQQHGWDGFVEAETATPWVPLGASAWEFGVNQDPAAKAEHDYAGRASLSPEEAAAVSFIFVTPRAWPGKDAWAAAKRAQRRWKDVRAYDASDLEQWLESSVPAQAWFADKLPLGGSGILDLPASWRRWAEVTQPELSKALFSDFAKGAAKKLALWLQNPPERPFTVAAETAEEGVAALVCAFDEGELAAGGHGERVIVVSSAEALTKIASSGGGYLVILASPEVQAEAAGLPRRHHTIVVTHRGGAETEPDLVVYPPGRETFGSALEAMGLGRDDVERLARDSGYSPAVLRRRLAQLPALKSPPWADQSQTAQALIPLALTGVWDSANDSDCAVVEAISGRACDEIEQFVVELMSKPDSPVWSVDTMRGAVSKVDAFYAVQRLITPVHLRRFFDVARLVLSEEDPALELPPEQQWAAGIYGKTRKHSSALRQSLCETLGLLAHHGDNLFRSRLGFDVTAEVNRLVRDLLTPLDGVTWSSQRHDLPRYAEAAPDVFLDLLEADLGSSDPKVIALLAPADSGPFSSPARTGLLWALETLAWHPDRLFRVVLLLAKLADVTISDNWVNKPENSLAAIFRYWMPQTAASIDQRIAALELLMRKHPQVGWQICITQFDPAATIGHYSAKPRWRSDASGAGEPMGGPDAARMVQRAIELALEFKGHGPATLGDLVERLGADPNRAEAVWRVIRKWLKTNPPDRERAELRERVRVSAMLRPSRRRRGGGQTPAGAREIYEELAPADPVWRHHWLFARQWVHESADEAADEDLDYRAREERLRQRRIEALREIWNERGLAGLREICASSESAHTTGWHLAQVLSQTELQALAHEVVSAPASPPMEQCLSGALHQMEAEGREQLFDALLAPLNPDQALDEKAAERLHLLAPFTPETWSRLERCGGPEAAAAYWKDVKPQPLIDETQTNVVVDALLGAMRPRAAFCTVAYALETVTTERLTRLLLEAGTIDAEPRDHYRLDAHTIARAVETLSARPDAAEGDLAKVEFLYLEPLSHSKAGIRTLERQLSSSPQLFVEALCYAFLRKDGKADPSELQPPNQQAASHLAESAYRLLSNAKRIPGLSGDGQVDGRALSDWITQVRALAREHGREEIAESQMGQLLAHSPAGRDGIWPVEEVREVLEDLGTAGLAGGIRIGLFNSRGAVWRGAGGAQERAQAVKYREWSSGLAARYPFTARMLAGMASEYERDAEWHDNRAKLSARLRD